MSASENQELSDLYQRIFEELGGRATVKEIVAHATITAGQHLNEYLTAQGHKTKVGAFLRRKGTSGLPQAPEVDGQGTHVQLELLSVEEFKYVVAHHLKSARASAQQARNLADYCYEMRGVALDLDELGRAA
ncbi:hypothetical protein LWF01_02680 [Saxibacter everestensis]|uniref:Uncharacterized protein n=1 Tax=Saxibacter everestensis TaxID=2909229 RepID=A0ABY8QUU7_9MICO|nr:hypothetical protein LWF01_02680 [Brevibacteriaceae bacterium ZFBP1038]